MQKSSSTALDCKYFVILHDTRFRFLDYTDTHIPSCLFITRNIFKKDIQRHSKENTNLKSCIISSSYCLWPCSLAVPVLAGWVYGFCCSMSRNTRRLNRQWSHPTDWEKPGGGGGGGGGTLIFSAYVGSDPASALHPIKISGISSTPKKYLKF